MRAASLSGLSAATILAAAAALGGQDRLGDPLPDAAVQRLGTLRMRYSSGIGDLCYLPDGRGVFATGNRVEVWDLAQGRPTGQFQVGTAAITSVVPRRDGRALLVANRAGSVMEWDLTEPRVQRTWKTQQAGLKRACYSPDETRVLTTGAKPPTLKEWDLETGKQRIAIEGQMHYFHEGIYGPDGKTAFVAGGAGAGPVLAHYDLASGEPLKRWHKDYYTHSRSISLSPDRTRLLLGSRHMGTEWRVDGYKLLKKFRGHHGAAVTAVAYCQQADQLLTGSRDGSIRRWDRVQGKVLLRWFVHNGHVKRLAVSPDGQWVLSYGARMVAETSLATGKPRLEWERHAGAVQCAAFLPDGRRVVSGSTDGTLRVWDAATGASLRTIEGAALGAYAIAVSPDGSKAAAGCKDGVVREFGLADGARLRELRGHRGYVRSVAYTHDGSRLLSSAGDGSICVWQAGADKPSARLEGHRGGVLAVAVSLDDTRVLSGGRDGTVRLWDLARARLLTTLEGHDGWVEAVAFVPGAGQGLSAGRDNLVLRWDLAEGKPLARYGPAGRHAALVCPPDGARAYTAGSDGAVACWDLRAGTLVTKFKGHGRPVLGLALSPDGRRLVSASQDTTLLVWRVP